MLFTLIFTTSPRFFRRDRVGELRLAAAGLALDQDGPLRSIATLTTSAMAGDAT